MPNKQNSGMLNASLRDVIQPVIPNIVSRLRETGSLSPRKRIRYKTVTNKAAEVAVLAAVAINPHASSHEMEREIGISRTSVLRILHRHQFHPFHISLHQALDDNGFPFVWNTARGFCIKDMTS